MHTMTNSICGIDDAHMRCTLKAFRQFGKDQRVGQITVNNHPEDVPRDVNYGTVIAITPDGHVTPQKGVSVVVIDGHHRNEAIFKLRKTITELFHWTREQIPVDCTIHWAGTALSTLEKMKNASW